MLNKISLTQQQAYNLDQDLFKKYDQLSLIYKAGKAAYDCIFHIINQYKLNQSKIIVLIGPGNNGNDGRVISKYLSYYFDISIIFNKQSAFEKLNNEIQNLYLEKDITKISNYNLIIDCVFGFSFKGDYIKEPYYSILQQMVIAQQNGSKIISIDIPSGWKIDKYEKLIDYTPNFLISLTCPKQGTVNFSNPHYLASNMLKDDEDLQEKYNLKQLPTLFQDDQQFLKLN